MHENLMISKQTLNKEACIQSLDQITETYKDV